MSNTVNTKGLSQLTLTESLALPYSDALARIQTGEWGIEQFTQWMEDRVNYAFGDGYEEGYTTGEEQEREKSKKSSIALSLAVWEPSSGLMQ